MKNNNARKDVIAMAKKAKNASFLLSLIPTSFKNAALKAMAKAIKDNAEYLKKENKKDIVFAKKQGYSEALIDRLLLNDKRIKAMVQCLLDTAKLKDPVGDVITSFKRPNGLNIKKVRTPIGVIGIIYESRPNVTSDCIGLCLKSGNSVILKGGKEAFYSNKAIFSVMKKAVKKTKIPQEAIQLVASTDREAINVLLGLNDYVDLIVPRGGEGLIRFVAENSSIPVIKHYKGVCHTYVSNKADLKMARTICFNAKVQRPGVCNAMETMLVHKAIAKKFLPEIASELLEAGVEIRGCKRTKAIIKCAKAATEKDWNEEYLDLILSVKVVDDVKQAIEHINNYGSQHSDAIITKDKKEADIFLRSVDSSCLYVNASTRFTDGYEFGFGAEIGISTDKLHARGPMALEELTTYKYMVYGQGQIRE
ncbi:MAG: glutamate-5-semialdehyde dehydrogenase [Candidatus Omnitrophica bacterium]|nr:glutamate-5-semialdehyde dehydrogenase [Candidatus Omnitrophota bacterium]MBU1996715.1 glutamate-5-semialdehyde dehydrogenase [Candidatus Omnitrophota bacterium]MBU4334836.1 glutamate-5-semialdehyde dehydrogenase [Candidatus Omnitrophota bacterium]